MPFLEILEDFEHPLLSPTLKSLELWGLWRPPSSSKRFLKTFIHVFGTLFVISQYVELWLIRDNLELALKNLSVTMLSTICVVKATSFIYWQKHWKSIIEYVSNLERQQIDKRDQVTSSIIGEYTKYSRKITYFYWSLVTATVFTVILAPLVGFISSESQRYIILNGTAPYPEILSSWLPFDRTRGFGYWISILEHSVICVYGGGVVATYDSNAVVLMSFFKGQLKLLIKNCERLFDDSNETVTYKIACQRIKACHNHHVGLIKFSAILDSMLSPVMFLYIIICSLMICSCAIQLTMESTGTMQKIWIAEYLLALIAQLFLYCWHSNDVWYMSTFANEGVYNSAWWSQNMRIRRSVLLLGGQLRKEIMFAAGPFTNLSISTFVAIMKGSYSYYTLLTQKSD